MSLAPGVRLGPYEVSALIGAGGMGEVYRATDTNLKRQVAIKVLPESVAADRERLARFQREAEVLAALNHPNIAQIHGLETSGGQTALVMELVEGPTLADRIARGPLPVDEALAIARQIAEAIEAAHEQGIIHRDLKPANIKVRDDGKVKVLDFGLAKALEPAASSGDMSQSPTMTSPAMTQAGVILGTAAYMSPEQARGKPVDKRSDIWAFGCVLYEMLTGTPAFARGGVTETLAAILRDPPNLEHFQRSVPHSIRRVVLRCLEKDRRRRFHDIGDVRLDIDDALITSARIVPAGPSRFRREWLARVALALGGIAAGVVAATFLGAGDTDSEVVPTRFAISPPGHLPLTIVGGHNIGISPDGRTIVYTALSQGVQMIAVRRTDELAPKPIPGTEQGTQPFFSPDGREIGFFNRGQLKRARLEGGPAATICDVGALAGASWSGDGVIVFADTRARGLFRVPAGGGSPERLTTPADGEVHRWPYFLPGDRAVVFSIYQAGLEHVRAAVTDLQTGTQKIVLEGAGDARYVPTGHLLYGTPDGVLMAAPFDLESLSAGRPIPVLDGVEVKPTAGDVNVTVAAGTLVHVAKRSAPRRRLIWMTRDGKSARALPRDEPLEYPRYPRLSPDGQRLALTIGPSLGGNIWVYDLAAGAVPRKLTFAQHNAFPVWTSDGQHIVYQSQRLGGTHLYLVRADGSQLEPEQLTNQGFAAAPASHPRDGSVLFHENKPGAGNSELWVVPLKPPRRASIWLQGVPAGQPAFSPDGRWVALVSQVTGRQEVYVRPFQGSGAPVPISGAGGRDPVWSRDGGEVYFQGGGPTPQLFSVRVLATDPEFRAAAPTLLFEQNFVGVSPGENRNYDVASDGRFLMLQDSSGSEPDRQIAVFLHWAEELKRLVPVN